MLAGVLTGIAGLRSRPGMTDGSESELIGTMAEAGTEEMVVLVVVVLVVVVVVVVEAAWSPLVAADGSAWW